MKTDKEKYKELFYSEAFENFEELEQLMTAIEKNPQDKAAINSVFRTTHTLKGNAMGLGFEQIAEMSHVLEDIFAEIQKGTIVIDKELFEQLFKGIDKLGALVMAVKEPKRVSYKGIRTKLEVYLKNATSGNQIVEQTDQPEQNGAEIESEPTQKEGIGNGGISFNDRIQVPVTKLDSLLNLVGELIIEKDGLSTRINGNKTNSNDFARLNRISSDLQYAVMDVRLVQVGFLFNKFHRIVRDAAVIERKNINLNLEGTDIEIDRNILKTMSDSLVHLLRNSVGHGIENPDKRKKDEKPVEGQIYLRARNEKDSVIIEVEDDGQGIDPDRIKAKCLEKGLVSESQLPLMTGEEILDLIFLPGFSNAETVNEISGRGVGMDVVKRATESVGGKVSVDSEVGSGTKISLTLPSSMSVKGALLFEIERQTFAAPLTYTEAVISLSKKQIRMITSGLASTYLDRTISIVFMSDLFKNINERADFVKTSHNSIAKLNENKKLDVVVAAYNGRLIGLVVDKLLQQKEIVEKTLSKPVDQIKIFSGATIQGNGDVCLVLDIVNIMNTVFREFKVKTEV